MRLTALGVKNYRSLEDIQLEKLDKFNVLIGRNNSGKSAIFSAISDLATSVLGRGAEWHNVLTDADSGRRWEVHLQFEPTRAERDELMDRLRRMNGDPLRVEQVSASPFASQFRFTFRSMGGYPNILHLMRTEISAEVGGFAIIQKCDNENPTESNPAHQLVGLDDVAAKVALHTVSAGGVGIGQASSFKTQVSYKLTEAIPADDDSFTWWPLRKLREFLERSFFFNPFRHSGTRMAVQQADHLLSDGANLAQVLHTIMSNNRRKFETIEAFIHAALPDVGMLQTPIRGTETQVGFTSDQGHFVRLHDMGGGIEQLLMLATVLLTTGDDSPVFLEEPESHLHAGAQRFLIERLYQGERQIFLTTHAPTFINASRSRVLYQVSRVGRRTKVAPLRDAEGMGAMLDDIGVRNSDVLLSDAVVFVEGPGDSQVLTEWSRSIGASFAEHNVTILTMGGGEGADRTAPIRSEVLEGISGRSPVPHLFILDRDERGPADVEKLKARLGNKVHFLSRRELENYLLSPNAVLAALQEKAKSNPAAQQKLSAATPATIDGLIVTAAEQTYGLVLVKRIRWELKGLVGGLLDRDTANALAQHALAEDLHARIRAVIEARVKNWSEGMKLHETVAQQRAALDEEWKDTHGRRAIAPGEELLSAVFRHFGLNYSKTTDAMRIATAMQPEEIAPEIKELLLRAVQLTGRCA